MEEEILKEIKKNKIISIIEFIIIILLTIFQITYWYSQDNCNNYLVADSLYEIDAFNNQFISFEGIQNGINIKSLITRLISHANSYRDETIQIPNANSNKDATIKIPNVFIDKFKDNINNNYQENQEIIFNIEEKDAFENYIEKLKNIRDNIENKHEYYVEFTFQDSGYLDYVIISYDSNNIAETKYRKNIID